MLLNDRFHSLPTLTQTSIARHPRSFRAVCRSGPDAGAEVAVKSIAKKKANPKHLDREIDILLKVGDHPYICKMFGVYETKSTIYICMELLRGGELFDRVCDFGPYSEDDAKSRLWQVASAIDFLHSENIIHRDLSECLQTRT